MKKKLKQNWALIFILTEISQTDISQMEISQRPHFVTSVRDLTLQTTVMYGN